MRMYILKIGEAKKVTIRRYMLFVSLGIICVIYASAAIMKLTGEPNMAARLNELNFAGNWIYFIGLTEFIGAPAIFVPKLRRIALLCLWPYAIAGLALHMSFGHERLYPGIIASLLIPISLWLDGGFTFNRNPKKV